MNYTRENWEHCMAFMNTKNGFITVTSNYKIENNAQVVDYNYVLIK
jgi:hypothetical protein